MYIKRDKDKKLKYVKFENKTIFINKKFNCLIKFFAEKFMEVQTNNALDLVEYANKYECDISNSILISHSKGIALCSVESYLEKFEIYPYIILSSKDVSYKYTFSNKNGCVKIREDEDEIFFICEEISKDCEVFVIWLVAQLEKFWHTAFADNLSMSTNSWNHYLSYNVSQAFLNIKDNLNLSEDENSLDKDKFKEYIIDNNFTYIEKISDEDIFKMCLKFKITPYIVKKYILIFSPISYINQLKGGKI